MDKETRRKLEKHKLLFTKKFRKIYKKKGIHDRETGEKSGVSYGSIFKYRKGEVWPGFDQLVLISLFYGVDPSYFFEE